MFVLLISKTLITYTRTHNFERTLFCNFSMLRWRFWLESLHTHIRLHTQFYCREPISQSQSRLRIYLQVIFVYSTNLRIGFDLHGKLFKTKDLYLAFTQSSIFYAIYHNRVEVLYLHHRTHTSTSTSTSIRSTKSTHVSNSSADNIFFRV
jgi:hypothetical protein